MTDNAQFLINMILAVINSKYSDVPPTIEELQADADKIREANKSIFPVSNDEYIQLIKKLRENVLVTIGTSHSLRGVDVNHQSWYQTVEKDAFYWPRYKNYLDSMKHWSKEVIRQLNDTTDLIMDDLGDPTKKKKTFSRRGLLLGDVQSGKTATYTAICNKAADCGYRVIIVLSGMLENLRFQTQERLDAEFAGRESRYALDRTADVIIKDKAVGVGKIGPFDPNKRISCFTTVSTDFSKKILLSNDLTLRNLSGTALFVVKKNKSVLNNLYQWLLENNADQENKMIDLPLLLIDDEADNASVNTQSDDHDPTAINAAIRKILASFYQSSYLGITATPFANIFIDPEKKDGKPDDLFPRNFITVLPSPSYYIGAESIFGTGGSDDPLNRSEGIYKDSVIEIYNTEMANYFRFKHKRDLADILTDLPGSLYEAMTYFILTTAIRDFRHDETAHASMMVNVSRFTLVQNRVAELASEWLKRIQADIEDYYLCSDEQSSQIMTFQYLKDVWEKHGFEQKTGCSWVSLQKDYLYKAAKRVKIQPVNQSTGSTSLNYYEYKNTGLRVIAIGGDSLSRGLTLEGLCTSYFYRDTKMYDTLLQMGRWFGYRQNYNDLFKIWIAEEAADWYGFITDATIELKEELKRMERLHQTPEDFGLKVRQSPNSLIVTARNKMRTGTMVSRPVTVSGRLLETPRLKNQKSSLESNENYCKKLILEAEEIPGVERMEWKQPEAMVWRNVPKKYIIDVVRNFQSHPWHLNFQGEALAQYIEDDESNTLDLWDVALPYGASTNPNTYDVSTSRGIIKLHPQVRAIMENERQLLVSGTHVKVGAGLSTRIGCDNWELIAKDIRESNKKPGAEKTPISDSTFLIQGRKPILMIHILETQGAMKENKEGRQELKDCPPYVYAIGLGFPDTGKKEVTANYVVNITELRNWLDPDEDFDDDDIL